MALTPRATHVLQWRGTEGCYLVTGANLKKPRLSSDRSLQLDFMKLESLVIAYQQ